LAESSERTQQIQRYVDTSIFMTERYKENAEDKLTQYKEPKSKEPAMGKCLNVNLCPVAVAVSAAVSVSE